jgi:hypothetical protein
MPGRFNETQFDYSGEATTHGFRTTELNDTNIVAQQGLRDAYLSAVGDISNGTRGKHQLGNVIRTGNGPGPAGSYRELKLLVTFEDTVTYRLGTVEIGCADLAAITLKENSDEVVLDDAGVMAAWVSAFEAFALSVDGNPVNVRRAMVVGRSI